MFDGIKFDVTENRTTLFLTSAKVIIDQTLKTVKISLDAGLAVSIDFNNDDALSVHTSALSHLVTAGLLGNNRNDVC